MRKALLTVMAGALIAGSAAQMTTAYARGVRQSRFASEQFRNANNSIGDARPACKTQEAGNPYDRRTDYTGWSAWRQLGAWDSRNDC